MSGPARVRVSGPLAPYAEGLPRSLRRSATRLCRRRTSCAATAFSVERSLVSRRQAGYTCWLSQRGVAPLLGYLRHLGVVPTVTLLGVIPVGRHLLGDVAHPRHPDVDGTHARTNGAGGQMAVTVAAELLGPLMAQPLEEVGDLEPERLGEDALGALAKGALKRSSGAGTVQSVAELDTLQTRRRLQDRPDSPSRGGR
jgi:hypothetical protein